MRQNGCDSLPEHIGELLTESKIAIEAIAEVRQVKTMSDYSVNIVLNLPETCKEQSKKFIDWQGKQVRLVVVLEEN